MSVRSSCLFAVLLALALCAAAARAADYTVYPALGTNATGYTDYDSKHSGEVLIYGGEAAGSPRMETGYLKFDVSLIPDALPVNGITFNFYVNDANWPFWSITPVALDPVAFPSTAPLLWDDAQAEKLVDFYNQQSESSNYGPGWKAVTLGGTANTDMAAALNADDYFVLGAASRDTSAAYFLEIDGIDGTNVPYLVVTDEVVPANDTCATALVVPGTPGTHAYSGDTTWAADDYDCRAAEVGYLPHGGGDLAYVVDLPAGCSICATLNQFEMSWNGGLYMVTDCADVNGTCVAGSSAWTAGGQDETFCYEDTGGGTYYIIVDGRTGGGAGVFDLDVQISCLAGPGDLTCTEGESGVDLAWSNNDAYESIEVYANGVLEATLAGTATGFSLVPDDGYASFLVCATAGVDTRCSDECSLIYGYDTVGILWDFDGDDGGFTVAGTGGWQWGTPGHGSCAGTADGNVWATVLDGGYPDNACWLLDSPAIDLDGQGGFICIDHCYETEATFDGGVAWFTTDGAGYLHCEPLGGADGPIRGYDEPICSWVEGRNGFTGISGGWVTDCWDLTGDAWGGGQLSVRLAFASDSSFGGAGWMIDAVTLYQNSTSLPIDCDYTITPPSGTVPFSTVHRITLMNTLSGGPVYTRRIAGRIAVTIGNGMTYNPWRAGFTNVAPSGTYIAQFPVSIPALATVVGGNTFVLTAMDVTPAPYNQPPYPDSGGMCTGTNVVTAHAP